MAGSFSPVPQSPQTIRSDRLSAELRSQLESDAPGPAVERVRDALVRLVTELALDDGLLYCPGTANDVNSPTRIATGQTLLPALAELTGRPWVTAAMGRQGALVWPNLAEIRPDTPAEEHRRLQAAGVRALLAVPLTVQDAGAGLLLAWSRQPALHWDRALVDAVTAFAHAAHGALHRGESPLRIVERPSWPEVSPAPQPEPINAEPTHAPARKAPSAVAGDAEDGMVGESAAWRYVMFRVDQVAATHATVLLLGETGTGKELIARAIHRRSPRAHARFVALNCAALPATLVESELFGREKGAFTGAHASQAGRFELAHRGTLFLDEVGDLPMELQPKLLRVLQEGQIDRLGGSRTMDVDVRVIAATNRELAEEVRQNRFRCDLYYRLNVFPITLPSLRDRREDIPLLVRHLADRFARMLGRPAPKFSPAVVRLLEEHDWPGNIRELENTIQRAIILSANGSVSAGDISLPATRPLTVKTGTTLEEVERDHILKMLATTSWRIEGARGAAKLLGLKPSTLRSRLKKLGVRRQM